MAFTPELGNAICEAVSSGEKSLRAICRELQIAPSNIMYWLEQHKDFAEQYARAKSVGEELAFEELRALQAELPKEGEKGVDSGWVQWRRLQIDTLKWELSKRQPKKYGDKVQNEHTGADGGPIQAAITVEFVKPKAQS